MSGELMREKPACTPPPVARTQLSRDAWVGRVVRTLLSLDRPVWERGGGGGGGGLWAEGTLQRAAHPACSGDAWCDKRQNRATDSAHPVCRLLSLEVGGPVTCFDQ